MFSRIPHLVPAPPDPCTLLPSRFSALLLPGRRQDGAGRNRIRHPHRLAEPSRERLVLHHRLVALGEVGRVLVQPLAYAAVPPDDPPLPLAPDDGVVDVALEVLG